VGDGSADEVVTVRSSILWRVFAQLLEYRCDQEDLPDLPTEVGWKAYGRQILGKGKGLLQPGIKDDVEGQSRQAEG
jgi:hypothetical protein